MVLHLLPISESALYYTPFLPICQDDKIFNLTYYNNELRNNLLVYVKKGTAGIFFKRGG